MKNPKILVVMLIAIFGLTACGRPVERYDKTPSGSDEQVTDSPPVPQIDRYRNQFIQALEKVANTDDHPSGWDVYLSPNGMWLAGGMRFPGDPLKIVSVSNPEQMLNIEPDSQDLYQEFSSWSPDSSRVVTQGTKQPGKCAFGRIILYNLDKPQQAKRAVFEIPGKENRNCYSTTWSPDGSKLAVRGSDIYILNQNAVLIKQISFDEPYSLSDIFWIDRQTILFTVRRPTYELRLRNVISDEEQVLMSNDDSFSLVDYNPDARRVLLSARVTGENTGLRLWIFDIKDNRVVKEINLQGYEVYQSIASTPSGWVGFVIDTPALGGITHFYVFDWRRNELVDYGPITYLLDWWSNINGFMVVKDNYGNYVIEVKTPKP